MEAERLPFNTNGADAFVVVTMGFMASTRREKSIATLFLRHMRECVSLVSNPTPPRPPS